MRAPPFPGVVDTTLALAFAFSNGFNDSASVIATVVSTRSLSPGNAVLLAGVFEFLGAYCLGTAVAKTVGKGIIDPGIIMSGSYGIVIIIATLIGSTAWNVLCTIWGFPISASHSLIGGFVGAGVFAGGFSIIQWDNILYICLALVLAPLLGLIVSFMVTRILYFFSQWASPKVNEGYRKMQIGTATVHQVTQPRHVPTLMVTFPTALTAMTTTNSSIRVKLGTRTPMGMDTRTAQPIRHHVPGLPDIMLYPNYLRPPVIVMMVLLRSIRALQKFATVLMKIATIR